MQKQTRAHSDLFSVCIIAFITLASLAIAIFAANLFFRDDGEEVNTGLVSEFTEYTEPKGTLPAVTESQKPVSDILPSPDVSRNPEPSVEPTETPVVVQTQTPTIDPVETEDPMQRSVDIRGLQDVNSAVICWLYVPGTKIDYAVLQEPVFNEYYYLRRNIYGQYSRSGWIFTPKQPDGYDGLDMHFLIFGHNMGGGSTTMFGTLSKYKRESFWREHPYLYLYYPNRVERWSIWSAYNTTESDAIYDIPFESGTEGYQALLESIQDNAMYDTGITAPESTERIVTLSTCDRSAGGSGGRFVVNAVLNTVEYK